MADKILLQAAQDKTTKNIPIWMMRQAGRYLPEYLEISAKHSFLEMCHTPELAAEITLQPIKRFGFDGAILFSDILTPLIPMGIDLDYIAGKGPVISNPIRNEYDIKKLKDFDPREELVYIKDAVQNVKANLDSSTTMLGFCGSPFTLIAYMIEGGSSKTHSETMKFLYGDEKLVQGLFDKMADHLIDYLKYKVESGVEAVQIFESTGGILSSPAYVKYALPSLKKVFKGLKDLGVPTMLYILNGNHLFDIYKESDCDVASIDWRIDAGEAKRKLGKGKAVQGNLNPSILFCDPEAVVHETNRVLDTFHKVDGFPQGYIFNLGHGILPKVPIESVQAMIDTVRSYKV